MSDVIQLLPDVLANQIAAGEVVQRPASVIKELLENSIDAGSTEIVVLVKESGKQLIRISDNGKGMSPTDARLCFERHATSKIRTADDLFAIRTMGFRGEALASIAAVAQVELKAKREEDELGTRICIEGSEVISQDPVSMTTGTQISVKNLFFNVPARRNFLKSNPVEMKHILEEFYRVSLAFPEVSLKIFQQDLPVHELAPGKLSKRIIDLFGKNYRDQLIPCQEDTPLIKLKGYIGRPDKSKKTRGDQYFFINNRYVRNNYLHRALMDAYANLISNDEYPFYVLFIEIDPSHIDVNVHPTKHEIKFDDERAVFGLLKSAIRQALGMHNISPSLDFSSSVNLDQLTSNMTSSPATSNQDYMKFRNVSGLKSTEDWEKLVEGENLGDIRIGQVLSMKQQDEDQFSITLGSAANDLASSNEVKNMEPEKDKASLFQVAQTYIVTPVRSGLLLIHQQRAHQRILYERFVRNLRTSKAASQQLLFPKVVELSSADFAVVNEIKGELEKLGFVLEAFGQNSLIIQGMPVDTEKHDAERLFEQLIEQFKQNRKELDLGHSELVARAIAMRVSVQTGERLENREMRQIIDELFSCENPNFALDKRRIYQILNLEQISSFF